ncbi:tetratricopeptide repeat protein [Oryzibacter oryziterrae]|uniref:tetratricopeptide repeat protein n=1 Tax=Oryzibacter oryziterrae TaxID=2766474 RepID=UPI001F2A85FE|nr:tetratricopeptide repeat protein [Oryzibacter oryziterrae]
MADIFDEVGEDLRRDQLTSFWKRYNTLIIGAAVLVVIGTGVWRGYAYWRDTKAAAAGDAFLQVMADTKANDHKALAESLAVYASSAPADYALLARFRMASEHAAAGEADNALNAFEGLSKESGATQDFRDLAAIRAAMITVDSENLDQMKARLANYTNDISPWRHAARELLALSAIKAQNWTEAAGVIQKLLDDPQTPADTQSRAQILKGLVTSASSDAFKDQAAS